MAPAPTLSPELTRQSLALVRALSAAARHWGLYPPEHPAVGASVERLEDVLRESTHGAAFAFAVTPDTLLVAGQPLPADAPVVEAARLLHDRDILQVTFVGTVPREGVEALLHLLTINADDLRRGGGPAAAWAERGHPSIVVEQIDYEKILEDREVDTPADRHDDVWRSLVHSFVAGHGEFDEAQQQRLLEISGSVFEIGDLANAVIEPKRNVDGSPLITTQAATVLAVFRHMASVVSVKDPDRLADVMRNVAAATSEIDPSVVLQLMQSDDSMYETPIVATLAASFDDEKVAELLATALARDGRATARLAAVFDTIAPDEARKQRVLTQARSMLSEQDFGKSGQFRAVWASMEALLLNYDESPYVSASYQTSLEGASARGEMLASRELPEELAEWVATLEQDNVRALSVLLVTDLLRIEENAERAAEIARDMSLLLDDLLLAGDFVNARLVLTELRAAAAGTLAPAAARSVLTHTGESPAMRDAAAALGDLDETGLTAFTDCCRQIGPAAIRALLPLLQTEHETRASTRATAIVAGFGAEAAPLLAPLADDRRWFVQRTAAILLGQTRSPEAVAPLQALLRRNDPRVLRHAVSGLAGIDDPAAARALQTVLRAASGESRQAVVEALVAERDVRVVPMLGRILEESDPFGTDHQVVLDALEAVGHLADDRAVPAVATVMRRKKFFGGRKARVFKAASIKALAAIGTPRAKDAIDEARRTGDRALRKAAREVARV